MRKCKSCGKKKPLDHFYTTTSNGKEYHRWKCKPCYRLERNEYKNKLVEWFYELRRTLKCERCGFEDHRALHFHHTEDNKVESVARMPHQEYAKETILEEIKKCEVLCANCHEIEHSDLDK